MPRPGFNGELHDGAASWQFLGNGYRIYNPVLMRFHSQDDMSPFGKGGINAYAYCGGDPVNCVDPSGHFMLAAATLMGLGSLGFLAGAAVMGASGKERSASMLAAVGGVLALGAVAAAGYRLYRPSIKRPGNLVQPTSVSGKMFAPVMEVPDYTLGHNEVMIWRSKREMIVRVHGHPYVTYWGNQKLNGEQLAKALLPVNRSNSLPETIHVQSCFAGYGGLDSPAQIVANMTGRRVIADVGKVFMVGGKKDLTRVTQGYLFTPQPGAAAAAARIRNRRLNRQVKRWEKWQDRRK